MTEEDAQLFEAPYRHVATNVRPLRLQSNRKNYRKYWWLFAEPVPKMRAAVAGLNRQLVTVIVAKHRIFTWLDRRILLDHALAVVAREDDYTFGVLQSRFHRIWSLRLGTSLEDRPRYTPTTCFETFPFPVGLTPANTAGRGIECFEGAYIPSGLDTATKARASRVALAAQRLHQLRDCWLNPPEWAIKVAEVVPTGMSVSPYPDRTLARPGLSDEFAQALGRRTLTNLYNDYPEWLRRAHENLDQAVAACYGWEYDPLWPDEQLLTALLLENRARAPSRQLSLA